MKKIHFILIAFTLVFLACKKDRTCACTETKTGTSKTKGSVSQVFFGQPISLADTTFTNSVNESRSYDRKYLETTKRKAKSSCVSYSEPYKVRTLTAVPASSFQLSVEVIDEGEVKYDCKLK
jgi:hypothetical protein